MLRGLLSLSLLFLAGCATSYQPEGYSGGYSEMKLNKDIYQVSFRGNGYTGSSRVQEYFLRRCAELTLQKGYAYFALVNQEANASVQDLGTTYNGTVRPNYGSGYNYSATANTDTVTKHKRTGVIKLFQKGTQPEVSYDAKEILKNFDEDF